MKKWVKITGRERRHAIIRKKIAGTNARPRVSVYRSINNLYAQIIDDAEGKTLISIATNSPAIRELVGNGGGNVKGAQVLGTALAEKCKEKGISAVVFDRSGYLYHGRIKALAEAARKGGLLF